MEKGCLGGRECGTIGFVIGICYSDKCFGFGAYIPHSFNRTSILIYYNLYVHMHANVIAQYLYSNEKVPAMLAQSNASNDVAT